MNAPHDRGPWIQTASGKAFYPFDPRVEEFSLEDVAHALSHECRWGGHTETFYSVGNHVLDVACRLEPYGPMAQLAGLHHDDSEAFLRDVPRPIKHHPSMAPYRAAEKKVQGAAYDAFGVVLTDTIVERVRWADEAALGWEAYALLKGGPQGWVPEQGHAASGIWVDRNFESPKFIQALYLSVHHGLLAEIAALS